MGQCSQKPQQQAFIKPFNTTLFEMHYGELKATSQLRLAIEKFPILTDFRHDCDERYHLTFTVITDHPVWSQIDLSETVGAQLCRQRVIDKIIEVLMADGLLKDREEFWTYFELEDLTFDRQPLPRIQTKDEYDQQSDEDQMRTVRCNPCVITVNEYGWTTPSLRTTRVLNTIRGIYTYSTGVHDRVRVEANIMTENKYWQEFNLNDESTRLQKVKAEFARQLIAGEVLITVDELDIYFELEITFNLIIHVYID
jgi:hypothetical protein